MPLSAVEVAELSRLLDEGLALDPAQREAWLAELERIKPESAGRLRAMLRQSDVLATESVPELPTTEDDAVATAGERVGPYVLIREIGRGGMGSVWLADRADGAFKRRLALKLPRLTWSAGLAKRMARERDIGALLEHPNIARLYDAGVDEHGRPYIAMEYIDGQPIDVHCREQALDVRARLRLFVQVVQAVAYAHGRLVLHRDLKPSNVLIDAAGQAHLLDFGIAKLLDDPTGADLTQEQGRVLTLSYAAPEHIAGRPIGVAADVYALGVLLHELLTGTLPYAAKRRTAGALEEAILAGDAPLASSRAADPRVARQLRGDLDAIIGKAIKRDPLERYQTAEALAADIERHLAGHTIVARPDSAWYRLRKAIVRHRAPIGAVTAVVLALLFGALATLHQGRKAAEEAERTQLATAFVAELFRVDASQPAFMDGAAARPTQAVLLERGVKLIDARFATQPALRAELYGAVGRVYVELGQHHLGSEFGNRQLSLLREHRAGSREETKALLLLGEAALAARRDEDAEKFAQQAVVALAHDSELKPDALALLARAQSANGKLEEAAETLARGEVAVQQQRPGRSRAKAWILSVKARLLCIQNRCDEAWPVVRVAIDEALAAEGPGSMTAFGLRIVLAESLITRNHVEEGRAVRDQALEDFESLGGVYQIRAAAEKARFAEREFMMGYTSYQRATAVMKEARSFLARQSPMIPAELLAEIDFNAAVLLVHYGELAEAEPLMMASVSLLQPSWQNKWDRFMFAAMLGRLQMQLGQHAAAEKSLREAIALRSEMGHGALPFTAFDWSFLAQNFSMQGLYNEAKALLAEAPTFGNASGDSESSYEDILPMRLAQIELDSGSVDGARKALAYVKGEYSIQKRWRDYDFFALSGELLCAEGRGSSGLLQLAMAEEALSTNVSPNSAELARLRAVLGLCALALGKREQAERSASLSQRAFASQARVSPYYKLPLKRLEQQLGAKST